MSLNVKTNLMKPRLKQLEGSNSSIFQMGQRLQDGNYPR